jgi:hypothetical protein
MSKAYDEHVEKALASIEDLRARELEATAAKLVNRRDGWLEFGLFFSALADERRGHHVWGSRELPISSVNECLMEQIKGAEAPSGAMVCDALQAVGQGDSTPPSASRRPRSKRPGRTGSDRARASLTSCAERIKVVLLGPGG